MIDPDQILPLLRELADCDLPARLPFFGPLAELADHPDPRLRAEVLRCLAGASGSLAFRHLVRGLGDEQQTVQLTAVEALRRSAAQDAPRWAHVLFHHDAAIRRAGLAGEPIKDAAWYALYLVSDPECENLAFKLLLDQSITIPASTLPAIGEMVNRGRLDASLARRLIVRIPPSERMIWLANSYSRSATEAQTLLEYAAQPAADDSLALTKSSDAFDPLIDLFWDSEVTLIEEGVHSPQELFFSELIEHFKTNESGDRLRVVASILVVAARRGTWPRCAVEACLALWPKLLSCAWVPPTQRRAAVQVLYDLGTRCRKEPTATIKQLVCSDFCTNTDGHLDLWVVGGLLHLLENHPYKCLLEWVTLDKILAAFWADPEASVRFLCLDDASETGRNYLLSHICNHRYREKAKLLARLVHAVTADGYDFLQNLSGAEAVQVFAELLAMSERDDKPLSENKTRVVAVFLSQPILRESPKTVIAFFQAWLPGENPQKSKLGLAVLGHLADELSILDLQAAIGHFSGNDLRKLVRVIGWCPGFPYGKERQLAEEYRNHSDWDVRRWALRCCPEHTGETPPLRVSRSIPRTGQPLTKTEIDHIATCGESALSTALKPALEHPSRGLCEALARRPAPATPNALVCAALLGCHDSLRLVSEQFSRFAVGSAPDFLEELERTMVAKWNRRQELPMIGHAWLYRWESHAFAFAELAERHSDGWEGQMRYAMNNAQPLLSERIWSAMARVVALLRFRDKPRLSEQWTNRLPELAVESLGTPWGVPAANLLIHGFKAQLDLEHYEQIKPDVIVRLPDMTKAERETLRPWVSSLGVSKLPVEARPIKGSADEDVLATIAASMDFDQLEQWCFDNNTKIADEAALRLLEFEEPGAARLLAILSGEPLPSAALLLAETISLWPEGPALAGLLDLVVRSDRPLSLRFRLGLQFLERGQSDLIPVMLALINADTPTTWFRPSDWARLLQAGLEESQLSMSLAVSPHPHAYLPAVRWLLAQHTIEQEHLAALRQFLEVDSERLLELRVDAASWLMKHGDRSGFPILVQHAAQQKSAKGLFAGASAKEVLGVVNSVLLAGGNLFPENRLFDLLNEGVEDPWLLQQAFEPMLTRCLTDSVREAIVPRLGKTHSRSRKLRRVAEEFAWGIRMGRELTGRLFSIQMIGGEDLGYTRLEENKIHITPMPILRGERNAREVVQGLILHEYGHHMYHRGKHEQQIWEQAHNEGMGRLLNLVSDEHLERNLRALDVGFGDRLKKLAAYAFQHSKKELRVDDLLMMLSGRAFEVLTATRLDVARRRGCIIVDNGQLLLEMERTGLSFARFVRALRMGLGNRHDDPKVQAGLELFRKQFRKSRMPELLEIARRLREIFGAECSLLESFSQDECLRPDPSDVQAHGEGITNQEVEAEIQRISNPRKNRGTSDEGGKGGGRWINVSADEHFETISTVLPVTFEREKHAPYAQDVARPARQLRQYLKDLGLAMVQHRMRIAGRMLDRSRIPAVVLRNDPRMLIARQRQTHNDLFLGVVIDCSGSMDFDGNIEKAKMFGALLAEAVNGLAGVDLRLFGFTDSVIYDAGNEQRPAVHALHAGGGNNDAAALWHVAQVAMASRRKAKVVVMISDGLPTECSAAALRSLATRLTNRHKICCAQVAVQPLEEICFPHYILLNEDDVGTSVRRFGATIARLVRRAMASG